MQPKRRNDRRLDLDANLQLRLTVRTHQTHLVTGHAALFGRKDADPANVRSGLCRLARQARPDQSTCCRGGDQGACCCKPGKQSPHTHGSARFSLLFVL
jgi:hypothetical protein